MDIDYFQKTKTEEFKRHEFLDFVTTLGDPKGAGKPRTIGGSRISTGW